MQTCEYRNPELSSCWGYHESDTQPLTTITVGGEFKKSLSDLAIIVDPRTWGKNQYGVHFSEVIRVADRDGNPASGPEPVLGQPWDGWIRETLKDEDENEMINTLGVKLEATPAGGVILEYWLGRTLSGSPRLERDFGSIEVTPVDDEWNRVTILKAVRFLPTAGGPGGNVGWGDLPNAVAPKVISDWLGDMFLMPCWNPNP